MIEFTGISGMVLVSSPVVLLTMQIKQTSKIQKSVAPQTRFDIPEGTCIIYKGHTCILPEL